MGGFGINRLGAIVAGSLAVLACTGAAPESAENNGLTFVSLNPCIDAILVEVAEPDQILALSHYSRDPTSSSIEPALAMQFAVTAGTAEEIIALQPDVVLASTFLDRATQSALERAGLEVVTFGSPSDVAQSMAQIREIAALAGHEAEGAELVAAIAGSPAPTVADHPSALLWQPGQIVAGEASLVAEHLRWAGFENHAVARGLGQADHVTLEQIVADPPDVLLVAGDAPGQEHPLLGQLSDTHVARFDPGLFYCAGPSIIRARERLSEIRRTMGGELR